MAQFPQLSNREWEVVKHLLEGKSNKLIAAALGISDRTVEFHLRNIYAKFHVSTRIELILKLGNATGWFKEELGCSTVASKREFAENRDSLKSQLDRATSLRDSVSINGKESEMKNVLKSKHVWVGIVAALLTGFLWVALLEYSGNLSVEDFTVFSIPLVIVLAMVGWIVGAIGKQRGETFLKVLFSVIFGTGLSPFTVIPLMMFVVVPFGRLAANLGMVDPSTIPSEVASTVAMSIMLMLWLIVSIILGNVLLLLSIKIKQKDNHSQVSENA